LSATNSLLPHRDFLKLLAENSVPLQLTEWNELVKFASNQCGRWQVRWLYSSATTPDKIAHQEWDGWHQLHTQLSDDLLTHVPDAKPHLDRAHEFRALHHALTQGLSQRGPVGRVWWGFVSQVALLLKRVGLGSIGLRLYSMALYPRGTVGRTEG
jgi:hypothetical protein